MGFIRMDKMLADNDQPSLREILAGWRIVLTGNAQIGDKYWRPADRSWIPLIWSDGKHGVDVTVKDMPIIIRKERN